MAPGSVVPVKDFLDATLDHRHLNEVVPGEPTAEHLARWIHDQLLDLLPAAVGARLAAVRVHETSRTWAEYRPS